jgi:hypothetical protein
MRGRHVFRSYESEKSVAKWFSGKLTSQLKTFVARRGVKMSLVTGFYAFESMTAKVKNVMTPAAKAAKRVTVLPTRELAVDVDNNDYAAVFALLSDADRGVQVG